MTFDQRKPSHPLLWPAVTMGCWSLISDTNWGFQREEDSLAAVDEALQSGIRAFDTAPAYGDGASEALLGKALKGRRETVFLATKVSGRLSATAIRHSCEESLRRLRTDYIDLLQLHWPDPQTPLGESAEALLRLHSEQKIRAIGTCNFGLRDLSDAIGRMPVFSNQMAYSLLWRGLEFELLPFCLREGIKVMAYSPLMQGLLTGKFRRAEEVPVGRARTKHFSAALGGRSGHGGSGHEEATFRSIERIRDICSREGVTMGVACLAVLLARDGIDSVVAGMRSSRQARENAKALTVHLAPTVINALYEATEDLKQAIGGELDLWQEPSRIS